MKNKILIICLVLVIGSLIGYGLLVLYHKNNTKINTIEIEHKISENNKSSKSIYETFGKKDIVKINNESIKVITTMGKVKYRENISVSNMIYTKAYDRIVVGSKLGYELYMFNQEGKVYNVNTKYPIINFNINKLGKLVVMQELKDKNIVTVYDENCEKLIERITYQKKSGVPIDAKMSDDGRYIAISYLIVDGLKVNSNIVILDMINEVNVDNIYATNILKDTYIYKIEFMAGNLVAISDKSVVKIEIANNKKQEIEIKPEVVYSAFDNVTNKIVLITSQKTSSKYKNYILIYNLKLEKEKQIQIASNANYFNYKNQKIIVGSEGVFAKYNYNGSVEWKIKIPREITSLETIEGRKMLAVNTDRVDIVNIN